MLTITINELERNTDNDGVVTVHWSAEKTDQGQTASVYGSDSFTPDPSDPGFIAYASLTEADVIAWLDQVTIESQLDQEIAEKVNPAVIKGLPW